METSENLIYNTVFSFHSNKIGRPIIFYHYNFDAIINLAAVFY